MTKPKISIITVVWNNKETIKDAIDSVLSQTYKNIEYIVVDGASSDGTVEIVQGYGDKISTFVSEKDKGISLATGELVAFMHSDDLQPSSSVVEDVMKQFEVYDKYVNFDLDFKIAGDYNFKKIGK